MGTVYVKERCLGLQLQCGRVEICHQQREGGKDAECSDELGHRYHPASIGLDNLMHKKSEKNNEKQIYLFY